MLVVDADDRVRESLTGLLAIGGRLTVVGSAGDAGAALDLAMSSEPDVVVVDPRMPDEDDGDDLVTRIRASLPDVRILAMSWTDTPERAALASGADAFVRKTFRPAELIAAILATSHRTEP